MADLKGKSLLPLGENAFFNPFMPSGFFYLNSWTSPFPVKGASGKCLLLPCFTEIPVLNANSVDSVLRRLIWVCTVCQCLFYGTPGLNGLSSRPFWQ